MKKRKNLIMTTLAGLLLATLLFTGCQSILVTRTGVRPQINTGVAGKEAGIGMVGAGLVEAPMSCFVQAVNALAEGVEVA